MTEKESNKPRLVPLLIDSVATFLAVFVLIMDGSAFFFWLSLGVFDGHWNDILLQVLFVCLIISYLFFLLIAAMYGLARQMSGASERTTISVLTQLGPLIDAGWDRALRMSSSCSLVVLSLLVVACLCWWRDLLWWSEISRGMRADNEHRADGANKLYEASAEIGTPDRVAVSLVMLATLAYDQQRMSVADRYFNRAISTIGALPDDNRSLLVTAYQGLTKTLLLERKYHEAEAAARKCIAVFASDKTPLRPMYLRLVGDLWIPNPNPPPSLTGSYTLLEEACVRCDEFDKAQKAFRDNLASLVESKSSNAFEIIKVTNLYADMLADVKPIRMNLLDSAFAESEKLLSQRYGKNCSAIVGLATRYGDRLRVLGYPDKAERCYAKAIETADIAKVEDFMVLRAMNGLASIYATSNRLDLADKTYKGELALAKGWKNSSPDVQVEISTCRSDYAALLRRLNRGDEAKLIQSASSGSVRQE